MEENLEIVRPRPDSQPWTVTRVYELFVKLAELRGAMAGNLSGGERQMLAVGRALVANPRVLLLDEPSEGLAPVVVLQIGRLMAELKETGLTMVLAEQQHRFALRHAGRAYLIERARSAMRPPRPASRAPTCCSATWASDADARAGRPARGPLSGWAAHIYHASVVRGPPRRGRSCATRCSLSRTRGS